ncbi:MAG: hypothetical protein IPM29_15060 [Planctomycetes bacterium]|nr:hypothetical protein [Planctomycetota bacterium]
MAVHEQQHTDVDIDAAAVIAGLRVELESLRNKYDILSARHDALLRRLYGKRTERSPVDGEGPLFAGLENPEAPLPPHVDEAPDAEEPDDEPRGRGAKERRRRGASRIPADIRRVVEVIEPTPEELRCSCCDDHRERHVIDPEERLRGDRAARVRWTRTPARPPTRRSLRLGDPAFDQTRGIGSRTHLSLSGLCSTACPLPVNAPRPASPRDSRITRCFELNYLISFSLSELRPAQELPD